MAKMYLTSEKEDIKKIDAVLKSYQNDYIDEVLYDDFIVCEDSEISDRDEVEEYNFEIPELIDIKSIYKYDPLASLRPEEKLVIDFCNDPDLKKMLVLNRTRRLHLIKLYKKIKDLLIECKQNIIEKHEVVKTGESMNLQHVYSKCWRLAAPYFKDKQYYLSPLNGDTLRKKADNELSVYEFVMSPKWSRAECDKLISSVTFNYNLNRQMAIKRKIEMLTRNATMSEEVSKLQEQLKHFKSNENELPQLNSDEYIDWHRVSGRFIKDKYSAFECRSLWHTYLHPKVNKDSWSLREDSKLEGLVVKNGFQNWPKIAESLGTRRTCLQVCMHYFRDLRRHIKVGTFTAEEDDLLLSLIEEYRMGNHIPWAEIVKHFKNRKRTQIYQRYVNYLRRNDRKRGKFSPAEDAMIMICVDKYGINYQKCVKHLPLRSAVQIKMRYRNNCQVRLKRGEYTLDEDMRIMEHVKAYGTKNWGPLAHELNRSTGVLRQRYMTITNFLDRHNDKTIKDVQRRKTNIDKVEAERYHLARYIADKYENQPIPHLEQLEEEIEYLHSLDAIPSKMLSKNDEDGIKACVDSEERRIDWKLVEFFTYSSLKDEQGRCKEKLNDLSSTVREFETALDSLQSRLKLPPGFTKGRFLDNIDLDILHEYKSQLKNLQQSGFIKLTTQKLFPPNLNTCLALKCLLINFTKPKTYSRSEMNISSDTNSSKDELSVYLKCFSESQRKIVLSQINIFYRQFYKLFKWPAMLSNMHANTGLLYSSRYMPMRTARRTEKHYSKQYHSTASVLNTNNLMRYDDQINEMDSLEWSIDSQKYAKTCTNDENSTEMFRTVDISEKNDEAERSQLSIQIIRSAKKGTEVIQVSTNSFQDASNESSQYENKNNKEMRTKITDSVVNQYSRKPQANNENLPHQCFQFKNECLTSCSTDEYYHSVQKVLEYSSSFQIPTTIRHYIENVSELSSESSNIDAKLPFRFVKKICARTDSHGDMQISQATDSRSIRVKTESMDCDINEQCPEKSPQMLKDIHPGINDPANIDVLDTTEGTQSFARHLNNKNSVSRLLCEELSESSGGPINSPIIGPLKLVPVTNKSIINDLLKNKSKKLFMLSSPPEKGQGGPFVKEIKLHHTQRGQAFLRKISPVTNSTEGMDNSISMIEFDHGDVNENDEVRECEINVLEQN